MDQNKIYKIYDYNCKICNKGYSSYQSYWNHNKNIHKNKIKVNVQTCTTNIQTNPSNIQTNATNIQNDPPKSLYCDLCNKTFKLRSTKSMHKQKCIIKYNNNKNELDKIKSEEKKLELLKEETKKLKEENKKNEIEIKKIYAENKINILNKYFFQLFLIVVYD